MGEASTLPGLWRYLLERFHPLATAPLALLLAAAGAPRAGGAVLLRAAGAGWLLLLAARALDDLADLPLDRWRRPGRSLPAGRASPRALGAAAVAAWGAALLVAVGAGTGPAGLVLAQGGALAAGASALRPGGLLLRPLSVNAVLPAALLLAPLIAGDGLGSAWPLALALWLAAAGHDLTHGAADGEGAPLEVRPPGTPAARARRGAALLGLALALGAGAAALERDLPLACSLLPAAAWLGPRVAALPSAPSLARAERLRTPGFLLLLLPLLARAASRRWG